MANAFGGFFDPPGLLRGAVLAAYGLSKRDIADRLVVTLRTVEAHLTASYRKLEIDGRDHLAATLLPAARAA